MSEDKTPDGIRESIKQLELKQAEAFTRLAALVPSEPSGIPFVERARRHWPTITNPQVKIEFADAFDTFVMAEYQLAELQAKLSPRQ